MKNIELVFPEFVTGLTGFTYGNKIYREQVQPALGDEHINVIFPDQIENVSHSFIQGFFSDLISEIGYLDIKQRVMITAASRRPEKNIWKRLF